MALQIISPPFDFMATQTQPKLNDAKRTPADREGRDSTGGQTITLSRKIVYFQAALLGIIATTFFVFGMMVGTLTSNNDYMPEVVSCDVSGVVVYSREDGVEVPDLGAVILLLSSSNRPEERLNPRSIHPDSFVPLENDVIDTIHELGGAVVRANEKGEFNVVVDSPAKYELIVISKNSDSKGSLSKRQMATLSTYFMPVESIRTDKAVHGASFKIDATKKKVGKIEL